MYFNRIIIPTNNFVNKQFEIVGAENPLEFLQGEKLFHKVLAHFESLESVTIISSFS